jgi:hypothetical protein
VQGSGSRGKQEAEDKGVGLSDSVITCRVEFVAAATRMCGVCVHVIVESALRFNENV